MMAVRARVCRSSVCCYDDGNPDQIDPGALLLINSAAFSAMARTVAFGWAFGMSGMTEASATRRPAIPCTRSPVSTTGPIPQVPAGW